MTNRSRFRLRRILGLGVLAAAGYAIWRAIEANRVEHDPGWRAQPFPFPPEPRPTSTVDIDTEERATER